METRFQEMKRYARFGHDEAKLVARMKPYCAPHFTRISQEFYDRIREHEDAHNVFTGEEQILRLQRSLVRWLDRLLSGTYDESYFGETIQIGRVHVKVGLPQHYMFTAMTLIRKELDQLVVERDGPDAEATRDALHRLLDLELGVMIEGYREHLSARIHATTEHATQELTRTLARTEHRYMSAVELARVLIVGLDTTGAIRLFNREAERVTGYERDEMTGQPFIATLMAEEVVPTDGGRVARALAGESLDTPVFESVLKTRSGKLRDVRWQLAYAPADEEDEVVLFVMGQDVTEARAAAELARQHEKLAAVGTLAAGLAHEIRNPLNGAQLHVAFLERALKKAGGATAEMNEAVVVVGDEIKRLAQLVAEFLDFARPKPLNVRPVVVQTLCHRAVGLLAQQAAAARVEITEDLPAQELVVQGDGSRLEQVLLNLLQNGIEALGGGGGGHVVLRARRQPRVAVIEVEDDGPGLPRPDAPIFDAFFSTKASGTGLGLAIVHRIVTDHNGTITVESRPGRTRFRVTVPLGNQ
jgi:PAS domain S-box-containing protein